MFDRSIAGALIQTTTNLVKQYIPADARGSVNPTVSCRNGGTAEITGTITTPGDSGVTNRALRFVMDACYTIDSSGTTVRSKLRTTGTITRTANFGTTFINATYQSSGFLQLDGTLYIVINSVTRLEPAISESCAFTAGADTTRIVGSYCGRAFSY